MDLLGLRVEVYGGVLEFHRVLNVSIIAGDTSSLVIFYHLNHLLHPLLKLIHDGQSPPSLLPLFRDLSSVLRPFVRPFGLGLKCDL